MARKLQDIVSALSISRQDGIEARYQELVREVEGLAALRAITGKAQADIARALFIKQPSVSRMERQTDMYLSTLQSYIRAAGGDLTILVTLPDGRNVTLTGLGLSDLTETVSENPYPPSPVSLKKSAVN